MSGKKRNKFYYFVEEIVRDLRQDGLKNVTWIMVNAAAGDEEWSQLGESEKSVYVAMARENKFGYDPTLTPKRRERLLRVRALLRGKNALSQKEVDERREKERRMREKMDALPSGDALADEVFFLIDVEYFVADPLTPCEFGVIEFSVKDGIRDQLHFFVDPLDRFPANRALEEKTRSETVHGIPFLERFEDPRFDFVDPKSQSASRVENKNLYRNLFRSHDRLARLLWNFLTGYDKNPMPVIFTLEDRSMPNDNISGVEVAMKCCEWLFGVQSSVTGDNNNNNSNNIPSFGERNKNIPSFGERNKKWESLDILPLEQLFLAFHRNSKRGGVTYEPFNQYLKMFLNSGKWDFLPKCRCVFHDKIEASCALGNVRKWCYAIFDHLNRPEPTFIPLFDFEMTDRHVPKSQPTDFVVHTMASLDACLEEEEDFEEASMGGPVRGITDAFADSDLFAQLRLNDNFRPNDSMDSSIQASSAGRPPRGLGRGTVMKKSA